MIAKLHSKLGDKEKALEMMKKNIRQSKNKKAPKQMRITLKKKKKKKEILQEKYKTNAHPKIYKVLGEIGIIYNEFGDYQKASDILVMILGNNKNNGISLILKFENLQIRNHSTTIQNLI